MRRYIRQHPILYPLYIRYIYRNKTAVFPGAKTQLHLTGYPRSANTYCRNIIRHALPELSVSTHIHTIASLKLAERHHVPIILLVRDPLSTTASLLLKGHQIPEEKTLRFHLTDYIEYHSYVDSHTDGMKIVSFENAISSPAYILRYVVKALGIEMPEEQIVTKATEGQLRAEEKEKSKKPEGSSLPNPERKAMKAKITGTIEQHPLYAQATALYKRLIEKETLLAQL